MYPNLNDEEELNMIQEMLDETDPVYFVVSVDGESPEQLYFDQWKAMDHPGARYIDGFTREGLKSVSWMKVLPREDEEPFWTTDF
jgi:hypothetical protein